MRSAKWHWHFPNIEIYFSTNTLNERYQIIFPATFFLNFPFITLHKLITMLENTRNHSDIEIQEIYIKLLFRTTIVMQHCKINSLYSIVIAVSSAARGHPKCVHYNRVIKRNTAIALQGTLNSKIFIIYDQECVLMAGTF